MKRLVALSTLLLGCVGCINGVTSDDRLASPATIKIEVVHADSLSPIGGIPVHVELLIPPSALWSMSSYVQIAMGETDVNGIFIHRTELGGHYMIVANPGFPLVSVVPCYGGDMISVELKGDANVTLMLKPTLKPC